MRLYNRTQHQNRNFHNNPPSKSPKNNKPNNQNNQKKKKKKKNQMFHTWINEMNHTQKRGSKFWTRETTAATDIPRGRAMASTLLTLRGGAVSSRCLGFQHLRTMARRHGWSWSASTRGGCGFRQRWDGEDIQRFWGKDWHWWGSPRERVRERDPILERECVCVMQVKESWV